MKRILLCAVLGCSGAPGGTTAVGTDATTTGGTAAATGSTQVEPTTGTTQPDPTASTTQPDPTSGAPSSSGSTTGCESAGCSTATATTEPVVPNELDCDDDLDEDGDGPSDCLDADCWSDPVCTDRFLRVATWNVRQVGPPGSDEHVKLLSVLQRIDADIVCMQEVGDDEGPALDALRQAAGYAYGAAAPAVGGLIRNACMSRHPIVQWDDLGAPDLSTDPDAVELTRRFLRLRIHLEPVDRYLTVLAVHFKAGETDTDRFRRMVESIRLGKAIALERATYPNNAIVAAGDFNERPDYPQGLVFDAPPADLPPEYSLGNDIQLPLMYAPFEPVAAEGVALVEARVEDTTWEQTYLPDLARLDYIYQDVAELVVSEVYEACEDDGIDGAPAGDRMPKPGDPLECGTNAAASDHRPVVAVFHFE